MCRLLGVVAERTVEFSRCLRDAPRSLVSLSPNHPDGWGIGVWSMSLGWRVQKRVACAKTDGEFDRIVKHARGNTLVAHIRKRTVGDLSLSNTHPFVSGRWIFAHNGTVERHERLRALASKHRLAEVRGDTDSELLFAHLLSTLDGVTGSRVTIDHALSRAVAGLDDGGFGATTFLLSDGVVMYAYRRNCTLHSLVRTDPGRRAVLFASDPVTDEPWKEMPEGILHRVTHAPELSVRAVLVQD